MDTPLDIMHIATELAPIAKVGGLGDVVYGLSKELIRQGHFVEILLPKYDCLDYQLLKNLKVEIPELSFDAGSVTIWSANLDNLSIKLIEPLARDDFLRGKIYGEPDDIERFVYFSQACLKYILTKKTPPNILHIHDWHPALTIPLLQKEKSLKSIRTVLTLHNLEYQGQCNPQLLTDLKIPPANSFLELGITYADAVTTVSPTYEKEIQTSIGGWGLDKLLTKNVSKLTGILNGIDPEYWNPEKDPHLFQKYSLSSLSHIQHGKKANQAHLRQLLGLTPSHLPLVACVTRLVSQKGPQLIAHALLRTLEKGGQFVLLGSSGTPEITHEFRLLKERFADNPHLSLNFDRNESLAHLIYASADLLLIPSLFEPCGLTQLIAMRYGTIPLVRKTGGLADTVFDIDTATVPVTQRNGFTFDFPDTAGINWALDRALECFAHDKKKWHSLIENGSKLDFSWKQSVQDYLKVYRPS